MVMMVVSINCANTSASHKKFNNVPIDGASKCSVRVFVFEIIGFAKVYSVFEKPGERHLLNTIKYIIKKKTIKPPSM